MSWLDDLIDRIMGWSAEPAPKMPGAEFHDRRKFAAQGHGEGGKWKVRSRKWRDVRGITLHQTACLLGERPERWDSVGAHIGITRSGKVIWLHSLDRVVMHGNGWNAQCVGIEIDGLYAGVEGDPSTVWDDPDTAGRDRAMMLTPEAAEAARQAIRWICAEARKNGAEVKILGAHRQSSKSRRNDPGSDIWKRVALPMHAELGLTDGGPGFEIGGHPIPEAWDPSRIGLKY